MSSLVHRVTLRIPSWSVRHSCYGIPPWLWLCGCFANANTVVVCRCFRAAQSRAHVMRAVSERGRFLAHDAFPLLARFPSRVRTTPAAVRAAWAHVALRAGQKTRSAASLRVSPEFYHIYLAVYFFLQCKNSKHELWKHLAVHCNNSHRIPLLNNPFFSACYYYYCY